MKSIKIPTVRFAQGNLARVKHGRPLRDLILRLPMLATAEEGSPDLLASSPSLLLELSECAQDAAQAISLGIAAVGNIVAYAAPEVEDGTIPKECIEALGWLLSELGEVAAACNVLAADCRQARSGPSA